MPKLDLGSLRLIQEAAKVHQEQAVKLLSHIARLGTFCEICGETDPEGGFYPMQFGGTGSLSGYRCTPCVEGKPSIPTDEEARP